MYENQWPSPSLTIIFIAMFVFFLIFGSYFSHLENQRESTAALNAILKTVTPTPTLDGPTPRPTIEGIPIDDPPCNGAAYCSVILPYSCDSYRGWGRQGRYPVIDVVENHGSWHVWKVEGLWRYYLGSQLWLPHYPPAGRLTGKEALHGGGRLDAFMCNQKGAAVTLVQALNDLEER